MFQPVLLLAFVSFAPAMLKPVANEDCVACHDTVDLMRFRSNSHGGLACVNCHSSIKAIPHDEKLAPVQCAKCHKTETENYKASVHGLARLKGVEHAATCRSCHGAAHDIVSPHSAKSMVAKAHMLATCGACHSGDFLNKLNAQIPHRASRMGLTPKQVKPPEP